MKVLSKSVFIVCITVFLLSAGGIHAKSKKLFSTADIQNLCKAIKTQSLRDIPRYMDLLVKKANISKEQWNTYYVFQIDCHGSTPLMYSLKQSVKTFKVMADFGIDLNHPVKDDMGNVSTLKDWVRFKAKTVIKFKNIYEFLKKKKAKGCNDLPDIKCTATYPLAPKQEL